MVCKDLCGLSDSAYCIYILQAGARCVMPLEKITYFNIAHDVEKKISIAIYTSIYLDRYAYIK